MRVFEALLASGPAKRVVAARFGGAYPAVDYLNSELSRRPVDQAKVAAFLTRIGLHGLPANRQKNKKIEKDLFELKAHQVRMPYFHEPGDLIIVTHVFVKKQDDIPPKEIERALTIKNALEAQWDEVKLEYPYARENDDDEN